VLCGSRGPGRGPGLAVGGRLQVELPAPHLGELRPLRDLAERLGEDVEVAWRLRRTAERAGELVPEAELARRSLDARERVGLIGLDAEHVEVRSDDRLRLAVERSQDLCELGLQLHAARERRLRCELGAHDLECVVEATRLAVHARLLAPDLRAAGARLGGAVERGERGVTVAALLLALGNLEPDLGPALRLVGGRDRALAELDRAIPLLVAVVETREREHRVLVLGALRDHALERAARGARISEVLVEQLRVLARGGGPRIAARQRRGQLGEHLRELVVVLARAVDGRERGSAERIARIEICGALQRLLGLDEVAAHEIDDTPRALQRRCGAAVGLRE